ncbi:hypothetical protein M378DRAFT_164502 [Amanita muscaria Koide BX008]|uniref:Uncharacterized protein n=1 Tax=Amanita muscaria (strain Koide BX008) TaxID=946122 RepID=A0A0C2T9T3_AMAMK|nr:hypothetical protein M378DRAFT_164502 [Amanita muscaria Koide BX008]
MRFKNVLAMASQPSLSSFTTSRISSSSAALPAPAAHTPVTPRSQSYIKLIDAAGDFTACVVKLCLLRPRQ